MAADITASDVTVALLSLARPAELSRTLETVGDDVAVEVILNGADLHAYGWVRNRYEGSIRFQANPTNIGVSAGWNQAIVTSATRFVVLSGDDLSYDAGWLDTLLSALNAPDRPDQVSLSTGTAFAAFCIDKALIAAQGWFDHNYTRIYYEDDDWSLRTAERLNLRGEPSNVQDIVINRLNVVERPDHERTPWNSIPNRRYFWRKWSRLDEPTDTSLFLRPHIPVERHLAEPIWPHLEPVRKRYARGEYSAQDFVYDQASASQRLLTRSTTNRAVIALRKAIQARTNPDRVTK